MFFFFKFWKNFQFFLKIWKILLFFLFNFKRKIKVFLVVLAKWTNYQNCFKMFKVFKIVSEIFQFCILQAIYAKNDYWLEKKLKKIKNFHFSTNFQAIFAIFFDNMWGLVYFFLSFLNPEEHFLYPYDVPSTAAGKAKRLMKNKIFDFFQFVFKPIAIFIIYRL